ncbi:DUF262 domain-containing protein [Corynebacterium casei]|uniref:DUF262 domain-containing protein n=1 Tax=Corynebacterium casei TaxID=160386 RepID=UPI003FD26C01
MAKLNIDQKTVHGLFSDKRSDFLIPDYQRPYAWSRDQCMTLWDDVVNFAIPEDNEDSFDDNEEYFLGPIVTFRNPEGQLEIIDGQQRLTTLLLLLRAFYARFMHMQDERSRKTRERIAQCIWKTDEFGDPRQDQLKINSEVASDDDKNEFLEILKDGEVLAEHNSRYAKTFKFFKDEIANFVEKYPDYTALLAIRILNNLILLPIEAESQQTALRIFSTLNDRGLPLADADIFKSQLYKYYSDKNEKDTFIERWKQLEETSQDTFTSSRNPLDELFTRYMYFERAKQGIRDTSTMGLRDFYEANAYALLKRDETLDNLESLLDFWVRVNNQEGFNEQILRRLYVLGNAPNNMWTYLTSVYYLHNRDTEGELEPEAFDNFLRVIIAFIWAYSITRPGVNALRTPVFPAMINIVRNEPVNFENHKFQASAIDAQYRNYQFTNGRQISKSMLVWWAFQDDFQKLLDNDLKLELEHIYSKRRASFEDNLVRKDSIESLGNKAFLEKKINIRASDYRFEDKKTHYLGRNAKSEQARKGTANAELRKLAESHEDFVEKDILARNEEILHTFQKELKACNLIAD